MPAARPHRSRLARLRAWRRRALAQMTRSRQATLALLARLPDAALLHPRTQAAWSILEVLGHVAAWETEGARRLALIARGQGTRIRWYDTDAEIDRFNAHAIRGWGRLRRATALARLARARARLVAALRRLPAAALADPRHALPVTRWLREFTWTHEAGHRRAIAAWWRATPVSGATPASRRGGAAPGSESPRRRMARVRRPPAGVGSGGGAAPG